MFIDNLPKLPSKKLKLKIIKVRFQKHEVNVARWQVLAFIIVFASIGGYIIYHSFATTATVASLQAEQMTLPANASIYTDSTASGSQAVQFKSNGTATRLLTIPSGSTVSSVSVAARGTNCHGWASLSLSIGGINILPTTSVSAQNWTVYSANANLASGNYNVSLVAGNLKTKGNCTNGLYVDVITFYGSTYTAPPPPAQAPTVSLSASPTSVPAGWSTKLTWSSTNASSCTAGGTWSGSKTTAGNETSVPITASSTFTLTCTGSGGSVTSNIVITDSTPSTACVSPTAYPPPGTGGMTYVNWTFGIPDIHSLSNTINVFNNPGTTTYLYLQLYDFSIDNTGQYFGLQTGGLALFSRWGTSDISNIQLGPGSTATSGSEGSPFISLRHNFGSLPVGTYNVLVSRASYDGVGDWFNFYVTYPGQAQTFIGAMRFPRANPSVPASWHDGGGTWTEDYQNNGTTLYPVPYWHVNNKIVANGSAAPIKARTQYSPMPNSDIYAESPGGFVDHVIGASTKRCYPASTLTW